MLACGCVNPVDILATWAGYGLLGVALLLVGLVCLAGLVLGAMVAVGQLVHRDRGDDRLTGDTGADEPRTGLAAFRWESEPD
ncbi:hypothetical protein [Streptomyces sp. NPDC006527]|jgi:hypothetical protein|uniref:hypothetical protein n=1 Tax=Streptomyces sp. NPDC006527 TaxID=3364749 RepID=UPI003694F8AB